MGAMECNRQAFIAICHQYRSGTRIQPEVFLKVARGPTASNKMTRGRIFRLSVKIATSDKILTSSRRQTLPLVLVCFHRVSEYRGSIPKIRVTKKSAFHLHPSLAAVGGVFPAQEDKQKRDWQRQQRP